MDQVGDELRWKDDVGSDEKVRLLSVCKETLASNGNV